LRKHNELTLEFIQIYKQSLTEHEIINERVQQ